MEVSSLRVRKGRCYLCALPINGDRRQIVEEESNGRSTYTVHRNCEDPTYGKVNGSLFN